MSVLTRESSGSKSEPAVHAHSVDATGGLAPSGVAGCAAAASAAVEPQWHGAASLPSAHPACTRGHSASALLIKQTLMCCVPQTAALDEARSAKFLAGGGTIGAVASSTTPPPIPICKSQLQLQNSFLALNKSSPSPP